MFGVWGFLNHEWESITSGVAERRVMKDLGVPNIARCDLKLRTQVRGMQEGRR